MNKKLFLLAGVAACLAACHPESPCGFAYTAKATINATSPESGAAAPARTKFGANNYVVWSHDDVFALYNGTSDVAHFELTDGAGTTTGTFQTILDKQLPLSPTYTAYYPTSSVSNGSVVWPTTQVFSPDQCAYAPMVAEGVTVANDQTLSNLQFRNMGGLLAISAEGTFTTIVFHGTKEGKESEITLTNCWHASTYYMAVEPGEYSAVRLVFINANNEVAVKSLKADKTLTVERSKITEMALPTLTFSPVADAVPIKANGKTVFFATKNYGADALSDLGTAVTWANLPAANGNWRVPTAEEMEVLFHWAKTTNVNIWNDAASNPDYNWSWEQPCVKVTATAANGQTLCLPTAEEDDGGGNYTYRAYYWSSTEATSTTAYMYNVAYTNASIATAEAKTRKETEAYVRLVYVP